MNRSLKVQLIPFFRGLAQQRGALFGTILVAALLSFEIFNFSTTQFALLDILGDMRFAGIRWATILALAFCGMDFAGIARIFTPEQGRDEPAEVWYLFGAWLLAAAFHASLTCWGVSVAIVNHQAAGARLIGPSTFVRVVPIFVAIMVWLIRVLIIGTFAIAGERLFTVADMRTMYRASRQAYAPAESEPQPRTSPAAVPTYVRPAPRPTAATSPEPTYHPVGMSARAPERSQGLRS